MKNSFIILVFCAAIPCLAASESPAEPESERAIVTLVPGESLKVAVEPKTGESLVGELRYRWYVSDSTSTLEKGLVCETPEFRPSSEHYEKWMLICVSDDVGAVGRSAPLWCSKLPVIYIDVENGASVVSKDIDYNAKMRMQGNATFTKADYLYTGDLTMHVRGNTSSRANKKPYKIKLDSKANLLKMGKNKHWILQSNPYDFSLMRNKFAYDLSAELGLTSMASDWVDLIMNGEFVGNYLVCEQIRAGSTRVDVFDWESEADDVADAIAEANAFTKAEKKDLETYLEEHLDWVTSGAFTYRSRTYSLEDYGIDASRYDITGGYIFEMAEGLDGVTTFRTGVAGQLDIGVEVVRPEYLKTNTAMLDSAKATLADFWAAVLSPDGYYKGVHCYEMCDLDSLSAYWLAQELPGQSDLWSRFAYKDTNGGLLCWGPVWDFDSSCGGRDSQWKFNVDGTVASRPDQSSRWLCGVYLWWAQEFMPYWKDNPYFVLKVVEKYRRIRSHLDELMRDGGLIDRNYEYLRESGIANANLWAGRIGGYEDGVDKFMRFDGENGSPAWFKTVFKKRVAWLDKQFATIRSAVASVNPNTTQSTPNRYVDSADRFAFDFQTAHFTWVESNEAPTPDILISNASDLESHVTLTGLAAPATVDVYVNGLSNGTYSVSGDAIAFVVASNRFTNTGGDRNMIALVVKDAAGARLATTYALVTTVADADLPRSLSDATVVLSCGETVPVTGVPIEPEVTITADGVTLVEGEDYRVEYLDNVLPGHTATVRIIGLGNPLSGSVFPRGNWVGTVERRFLITEAEVCLSAKTGVSFDTREGTVRVPADVSEILPLAWNDDSSWARGGCAMGKAVLSAVQMTGDAAKPESWTIAGPERPLVSSSGEGVWAWDRPAAKLYRVTLVNNSGAVTNTAYFDLTGLELPDSLELLRKAFGETVEIGYAETGDPNVKLTRDVMGPITLCEGIGAFTLDLGGRMISGTRGADGADGEAGCRGGPAIVVASDTAITVRDDSAIPGAVRGGKGGWGNPPGEGGAAIVDKQGRPVSVSGRQDLVVPGAQGTPPKGGALFLVKWTDLSNHGLVGLGISIYNVKRQMQFL